MTVQVTAEARQLGLLAAEHHWNAHLPPFPNARAAIAADAFLGQCGDAAI
jgi:hypothetical protein